MCHIRPCVFIPWLVFMSCQIRPCVFIPCVFIPRSFFCCVESSWIWPCVFCNSEHDIFECRAYFNWIVILGNSKHQQIILAKSIPNNINRDQSIECDFMCSERLDGSKHPNKIGTYHSIRGSSKHTNVVGTLTCSDHHFIERKIEQEIWKNEKEKMHLHDNYQL